MGRLQGAGVHLINTQVNLRLICMMFMCVSNQWIRPPRFCSSVIIARLTVQKSPNARQRVVVIVPPHSLKPAFALPFSQGGGKDYKNRDLFSWYHAFSFTGSKHIWYGIILQVHRFKSTPKRCDVFCY